ncbi:MAG UNVERIFIED_CONTAM: hypothetical protein LVR29_33275 [Microcystis novacekii LVE1205-3]|jgi:hypothetical protein
MSRKRVSLEKPVFCALLKGFSISHLDSNGSVEELAQEWVQTLLANLTT